MSPNKIFQPVIPAAQPGIRNAKHVLSALYIFFDKHLE